MGNGYIIRVQGTVFSNSKKRKNINIPIAYCEQLYKPLNYCTMKCVSRKQDILFLVLFKYHDTGGYGHYTIFFQYTMGEKFNLTWHSFSSHGQELFKNLLDTQNFTDVTLISDDLQQYRVHKFILSACSTVFRNILKSTPLNTSIYLRGIHHEELESIIQFIYLGEATFYHERMNEFINVAKNLDIKEIGKYVVDEEEETGDVKDKQTFDEDNSILSDENPTIDETEFEFETILGRTSNQVATNNSSSSVVNDQKKQYKCQHCTYQAINSGNLKVHVQTKHEGIKYPCQQCDYQATQSSSLQMHIKSKHEGVKYPCQQCDYQATHPSSLQMHIKSKHEGVKYPCQQCDYQATQLSNFKRHVKAIH